jgi:hypothetical protein
VVFDGFVCGAALGGLDGRERGGVGHCDGCAAEMEKLRGCERLGGERERGKEGESETCWVYIPLRSCVSVRDVCYALRDGDRTKNGVEPRGG